MRVNYFNNPSALKIDLMLCGVRLDAAVEVYHGRAGRGIDLLLPSGAPVNVPCMEEYTEKSPYLLREEGKGGKKGFLLTDGRGGVAVKVVPPPGFLKRTTGGGVPFSEIAIVHGSYAVITPEPGCGFFEDEIECRYCAGNFTNNEKVFSVEDTLETVEAALKEKVAIIYLSVGFSRGDDGGVEFLAPYIRAIKKHFNCLVAVEALPPKKNKWIDETYALGVDSVVYNLEIFDCELFAALCPGRAEKIGRERYVQALKYAAGVFPSGTVASHLIVGLEPPGSTSMGIDFLTEMGVVPILPIYRPRPGGALRIEPLTAEIIIPVYKHLYRAVKKNSINMNWVRDISIVTTPIEGRMLVGGKKPALSPHSSRLFFKAGWGLSAIRRKLRVKEQG